MSYTYLERSYGQCCNDVVDPITLLVAIGAIAAVSWFLRQAVIDNNIKAGKKKKRSLDFDDINFVAGHLSEIIYNGNLSYYRVSGRKLSKLISL